MSSHPQIPVMLHPTTVVAIDDDESILTQIGLSLGRAKPHSLFSMLTDDPKKMLSYLQEHTYQPDALAALLTQQVFDVNSARDKETFVIDFSKLKKILTTPERFKRTAVALVDRMMTKVDGLALCQQLRNERFNVKTVLFTGKTEMKEAIDAFNQKIIDSFLIKEDHPDAQDKAIKTAVFEAAWQLFVDLSASLSGLLAHVLKPLTDKNFLALFNELRALHKMVEFYLLDSSCSFLMVDAAGRAKQLLVRNHDDFKDCLDVAEDKNIANELLDSIRQHQQFPFTTKPMGFVELEGDEWQTAMTKMQKIPNTTLYYALVDCPELEVYSFDQYQRDVR